MLKKVKNYFDDWSRFEVIWLFLSSAVMIALSIIWKDNFLALISGLTGIIGVVLAAKGKISTYIYASVNVAAYAWICFNSKLYGETMLNALYFLPMNIVGFMLWKKHKNAKTGDVQTRNFTLLNIILLLIGTALAVIGYWRLLVFLGGELPFIDSMTTVISVIALLLQVFRYSETWLLWIIVNVISVIMWTMMLIKGDSSAMTMIVMWSAYLVNSVYGYLNWRKTLSK